MAYNMFTYYFICIICYKYHNSNRLHSILRNFKEKYDNYVGPELMVCIP